MEMNPLQFAFFKRIETHFAKSIEKGLKVLLEEKHLYQNVKIEAPNDEIIQQEAIEFFSGNKQNPATSNPLEFMGISLHNIEWNIVNEDLSPQFDLGNQPVKYAYVNFCPPTIKLYCSICKRIEAYNFKKGYDLLSDFRDPQKSSEALHTQIFSFAYQCQSCKSIPEIFIVRRDKYKLIQSGRSPIENIDTPSFLPKNEIKYFSDAVIAFNSGQILAGNFLLRVFLEQYVRIQSSNPKSKSVEDLFSEYSEKLPIDFKKRFPSLQFIYDILSNDLHLAIASEEVFEKSKNDIEEHFEAKKIYKIPHD